MRSASNKHTGGLQARPGANKPFMTEYKLAFRDPGLAHGRKNYGSVVGTIPRQRRKVAVVAAPPLPVKEVKEVVVVKEEVGLPVLPSLPGGLGEPSTPNEDHESTSLTLPGMVTQGTNQPIQSHFRRQIKGEPYSGYKEGRRAVIQSFAHIDSTTNARTPGYNIISNTDSRPGVAPK
ncbi:hypothetical protein BC829DRAFT_447925 [Chytridium lagenaria]|nr:hypothetical protein BC829DRAFT_447925 [Chytridium lagenaria]